MSITASYGVCRSEVAIEELSAYTHYDDWCEWSDSYRDHWQVGMWPGTDLTDSADQVLADVVNATQAPSLLSLVVESDYVVLWGRDTSATTAWRACLCRSAAAAHLQDEGPLDAYFLPADAAAERALQWAQSANLVPSPPALAALLATDDDERPAEAAFFDFLGALGLA